jgi:hypothetical protein
VTAREDKQRALVIQRAARFCLLRDFLGWTNRWIKDYVSQVRPIGRRTVDRWALGDSPIPQEILDWMEDRARAAKAYEFPKAWR